MFHLKLGPKKSPNPSSCQTKGGGPAEDGRYQLDYMLKTDDR